MIEKTPYIDDVSPGGPTRADWGNSVRDAAAAHYPGGSFVGSSRGGYHRPPLVSVSAAGTTLRFGLLTTDLDLGGTCTIQEYIGPRDNCVPASTYTAYDPLGELQGTGNLTCCQFYLDSAGEAALTRVTCPLFVCVLCVGET